MVERNLLNGQSYSKWVRVLLLVGWVQSVSRWLQLVQERVCSLLWHKVQWTVVLLRLRFIKWKAQITVFSTSR